MQAKKQMKLSKCVICGTPTRREYWNFKEKKYMPLCIVCVGHLDERIVDCLRLRNV